MARQLYVGTMMASRQVGNHIDNNVKTFTVLARSVEEAEGAAYRLMGEDFPSTRGYSLTGKLSFQTREIVAEWLAAYDERAEGS